MSEASDTTRSELGGYRSNTTDSTGTILITGILAGSEDSWTVITNTLTNDKTVQVAYVIESDSESDEGSSCDTEDSDFVDDD